MIKFGSVCSGIEAASVAWHPLGWKAAWLSEIEPFPSAVLAHHYPDVPNLGDMTTLPNRISSGEVEAPDLFCGGTPCQAFSVAGTRKSLDDERGNLSLTFCEIANAIDTARDGIGLEPAIIFWENVPGVLSTKDNAFGCFLAGLAGEDEPLVPSGEKWSNAGAVFGPKRAVAWRILDAQYFGVAQRRRRVFVVASARNGFDPASVLFEFDGLRRDFAPSRETKKDVTECAGTLTANGGGLNRPAGNANELDFCVTVQTAKCLTAGGNMRYDFESEDFVVHGTQDPCVSDGLAFTLGRNNGGENALMQAMPINTMIATRHNQLGERTGFGIGEAGDPSFTLTKGHSHAVYASMAVRRLTPVECERLQGFPDNYTNIPWRTYQEAARKGISYEAMLAVKGMTLSGPDRDQCPDGPRYKALGNSWAVPVVRWIGERINLALEISGAPK